MRKRVQKNIRENRHLYTILVIMIIITNLGIAVDVVALRNNLQTSNRAALDSQSLNELDIYQESGQKLTTLLLSTYISKTKVISIAPILITELQQNQQASLNTILASYRTLGDPFNTITLFSPTGVVLAASTDDTSAKNYLNTNESSSFAYQAAIKKTGVVMLSAHLSQAKRDVISFSTRVQNSRGNLIGVIAASVTLSSLSNQLHLWSNYDTNFTSVLVGTNGNLVLDGPAPVQKIQNISETEPVFSQLKQNGSANDVQEYNFAGQNVFANGSTLNFGNGNELYLISYYNLDGYKAQQTEFNSNTNNLIATLVLRYIIFFLALLIIVATITRKNEKHIRETQE